VAFTDTGMAESHTASASIDDGCPSEAPVVREARGSGEVIVRHTFCREGSVTVKVRIRDRAGNATEMHGTVAVGSGPVPSSELRAPRAVAP